MNKLTICCSKFEDRIKEDRLAEKRGWKGISFGCNSEGYCSEFIKKEKKKEKKK